MRKSFPILALLPLLAGCGGGGSSSSSPAPSGQGRASVTVAWPARGRFVPLAANSVVVELDLNGVKTRKTLARSGDGASLGTASFTNLRYGAYAVIVKAYPTDDGSGVAQASGLGAMTVTEDVPGSAAVSLATTVETVSILPAAFDKGQTATLGISAKDENGAIVLLESGGAEVASWTTTSSLIEFQGPTEGPTVRVKGLHSGVAAVRATLTLGGDVFAATANVTVNAIDDGTGTVTIS